MIHLGKLVRPYHKLSRLESLLLGAVDDPVLAILRLRGSSLETHDIGASESFRDCQTDELLPTENLAGNALAQFGVTKVEYGRETNNGASVKTISVPASTDAGNLLLYDKLVEVVELSGKVSLSHSRSTRWKLGYNA